ncbi:cysteine--tRNA ligase [Labrys neptuniae]
MVLRLYDTRTRSKVDFTPIDPDRVRMYVCGPTVYDFAHIGNARPIIVFDLLFRLLRHTYGAEHVSYARNITDVDDKINERAAERGITIRELTDGTLAQFHRDIRELGVLMPDQVNQPGQLPQMVEPRATDHIEEMKAIIERLVARGVAYVAEEHVLFSVHAMEKLAKVPRYGALARRSLDEMLAGARVDVAPYKRDAMDFVLWKPSHGHQPGWPSPSGIATPGRPGWHIECSAMSMATLLTPYGGGIGCDDPARNVFDIHGGGIDLVFPHHENEIAQSCCAFDTPVMANVWMHNGFLQVESEKMSKSLGNFITIRELLGSDRFGGRAWHGDVLRLAMLRTHYRQPIDWTLQALTEAQQTLLRWYEEVPAGGSVDAGVIEALSDDLNTPAMLARLHQITDPADRAATLAFLGFSNDAAALKGDTHVSDGLRREVEALLAARKVARAEKNWPESDRIRDELARLNITVKDNKDGTTSWEVKL